MLHIVNKEDLSYNTNTPIFTYCRKLIADGVNPDDTLEVHGMLSTGERGLHVRVKNIGLGSKLSVYETRSDGPYFITYREFKGVKEHSACPSNTRLN